MWQKMVNNWVFFTSAGTVNFIVESVLQIEVNRILNSLDYKFVGTHNIHTHISIIYRHQHESRNSACLHTQVISSITLSAITNL